MLVKRHSAQALALAAVMAVGLAIVAAPAQGAQSAAPAAAPAAAQPSTPPATPAPASGASATLDMAHAKQTFETTCSGCHDPGLASAQRKDRQGWQQLVDRMVGMGLSASDAQLKEIVDYLAATYPAQ